MTGYNVILFDLDGTLSDPRPGVFASLQYALARYGVEERDTSRLEALIGPPLWQALIDRYGLDAPHATRVFDLYRQHFLSTGIRQFTAFPGIGELLAALQAAHKTLLVATSRKTAVAEEMLDQLGLRAYFSHVAGDDRADAGAGKAAIIAGLLSGLSAAERGSAVMVGDLASDITAARANGIDVIAVAYGTGEPATLCQANPTHFVRTVAELGAMLGGGS